MRFIYDEVSDHDLNIEVFKRKLDRGYELLTTTPNAQGLLITRAPDGTNVLMTLFLRPAFDANDAIKLLVDEGYTIDHLPKVGFQVKLDYDLPPDQAPIAMAKELPRAMTIAWLQLGDFKADLK